MRGMVIEETERSRVSKIDANIIMESIYYQNDMTLIRGMKRI